MNPARYFVSVLFVQIGIMKLNRGNKCKTDSSLSRTIRRTAGEQLESQTDIFLVLARLSFIISTFKYLIICVKQLVLAENEANTETLLVRSLCVSLLRKQQNPKQFTGSLHVCKTHVPLLASMFQSAPHIYMGGGSLSFSAKKPRLLNRVNASISGEFAPILQHKNECHYFFFSF